MPMPTELETGLLDRDVCARTVALAAAAAGLDERALREASGLPGWTRAHVLAHVALNAEAFGRVLTAAAHGEQVPMYPSRQARDADIEALAGASGPVLLTRLLTSADTFSAAWGRLPVEALDAPLTGPGGWVVPLGTTLWRRWREVALHQVDLAAGFGLTGFDAGDQVGRLLAETAETFASRDDVPPLVLEATDTGRRWELASATEAHPPSVVAGTEAGLIGWLTGRTAGADLQSTGALPALPAWA